MKFQSQTCKQNVEKIFEVMLICTNMMVAHTLYNISVHYYCNTSDTLSIPSNSELKNSLIKNTFVDLTTYSAKMP